MKSAATRTLAFLACLLAGTACIRYESHIPSRRMEVGPVLARLSQPDSTSVFESLQMLAVAPDAQSVYVLDRLARRVYRVSVDGGLLAGFGRRGNGPDEIADATAIRASHRGVWVLDGQRGRLLLFSPEGELLETVQPGAPWRLGGSFAPVADGLLFPDLSSFQDPNGGSPSLLARAPLSGAGFLSLDAPARIPSELTSESGMRGVMERQIGWTLISVAPGEVQLVLNRSVPAVWSLALSDDRITDIAARRVPPQVFDAIRSVLAADRPPPGAELRPITGVHAVNGRLWVATGGIQPELVGFSVPSSSRIVPTVLEPGSLLGQERIRDGVVIGDRFIGITETEVLWADLVNLAGVVEADR